MGIIPGGILGGFRNKTGAVVGSYWRTLNIIKGMPRVSGKKPTEAQLDQRAKFKIVTNFLSWFGSLIQIGYKSLSHIDTEMNVAVSFHLKEAITGVSPNFALDYSKVMFSQGRLTFESALVTSTEAAQLVFTWRPISMNEERNRSDDRISILLYNPSRNVFISVKNVVARSAGVYAMSVPEEFSGEMVHCYMAMNSVFTKNLASNSFYAGLNMVL